MLLLGKCHGARSFFIAASLVITLAGTAGATSRQSGQIEDRLPGRESPRTAPASSVPETSGEPDAVKAQAIFLNALDLKGSTVLAKDDVDSLATEFIGKSLSTEDLARLAGRLTQAYRDRGFFLSRVIIPPQEIKAGRLTAQAIEGYVVSARGEGVADDDAASQFASLLNERPASLATFERALLLMSDRYGYKVSGTRLLPVEGTSDQFQLEFAVTWRPVSLEFFADNRGTGRNGEDQAFTGVSWKSILSAGDQLSASIFSSFANIPDTLYGEVEYGTPWFGGNLWTEIGASATTWQDPLNPHVPLGNFEAQKLWAKAAVPLLRSRERSLWLNMILDARDSSSDDGFQPTRKESLRTLRGSFSYTEVGENSRTGVSIQVSQGLDGLGASRNGDQNLSRVDSRPQFTRVRLSASFFSQLVDRWSVNMAAIGQYADGSLPSSEHLYYGGSRYGRGYDYDVIGGDNGWMANAELRYTVRADFLSMNQLQFFVFADAGRTRDIYRGTPGYEALFASSTGGGIRLFIVPGLEASVEAALPLAYTDSLTVNDTTRIFVTLSWWQ